MMKKRGLLVTLACLILTTQIAFTENLPMEHVSVDVSDKESLQRGAKIFMNYCSGCHSLKYMRYNRMAQDLGLITFDGQVAEDLLKNNLIFTQASIYDPIQIAMSPEDAKQWFGMVPPDLSLSARDRGPSWIYNYLKSFYSDPSRPFGTNNLLIPDVAMPNVLEPLIGKIILVKNKNSHSDPGRLLLVKRGEMFEGQLDSTLRDLVNFLVYVGEPAKLIRYKLGVFVILFFCIFLVAAYSLKKAYWKQLR